MAKSRALGTTIKFGSEFIGALTSIGEITPDSEELDATTLDSGGGYREFLQGFKDSGEVTLSGYYNKADAGQQALITGYGTGLAGAVVIAFPGSTGGASFQAYVKSYTLGAADVDGIVGFGATLRISGEVTPTT
ncbi:MAG: phage tail tube protein [Candidatus Sumerlaeales bacterium]|nr:phage tail tube protein [Candidatus Sumerlaeales bacterium]